MFTPLRRIDQALFLATVIAGMLAAGCSSDSSRARTESAAAATPASSPDSQVSATDSGTPAPNESSTSQKPSVAQDGQTPLPRPSIDPGRKPAKTPRPRPATKDTNTADADSTVSRTGAESTSAAPAAPSSQSQWLKYEAGSNTVTFELIAGPFNWNGFANGSATLTLPPKANVVMNFVNKDGTPHSAEIISGEGPIPNAAGDPAIPRAYTNKALEGLPQEATDVMRFSVPESGTYRIFCGVPGHGLSGMWIWMKVDPAAKAPSFGPTKA
jgi:hypothetical protein